MLFLLIFLVLYVNVYQERYTVKYLIYDVREGDSVSECLISVTHAPPPPPPGNTSSHITQKLVNHNKVLLTLFELLGILKQALNIYVSKMAFPIFYNSHNLNILTRVVTNVTFSRLKRIISISIFARTFICNRKSVNLLFLVEMGLSSHDTIKKTQLAG